MNIRQITCPICSKSIEEGQPRFYFPKLHPTHELADLHGVVHLGCIRLIDRSRHVGQTLASITEGVASHSTEAPLLLRDGNIVLRDFRRDENRIEVIDYENFCEISLPIASLKSLLEPDLEEAVTLGMQVLHVTHGRALEVEFKKPVFVVDLPTLTLSRLLAMLATANIESV